MRELSIILVALLLTACNDYNYRDVAVTVVEPTKESTEWGCIGTDDLALVEADGLRQQICGYYGQAGTVTKGCIINRHWDSYVNGLHIGAWCENYKK